MRRIRCPSHATVVAYLALFVALGGTAMAAIVVSSNSQVAKGTISGHTPPSGKHANLISGSVNGQDIANESLTGADIKNRSGVQTCKPPTTRYGALCVYDTSLSLNWKDALTYCADSGMRLPSLGEALQLAWNHDLPNVDETHRFWTQDGYLHPDASRDVDAVNDGVQPYATIWGATLNLEVLCVAQPSA